MQQKPEPLSLEEQYILAIEALEREVNNGGYRLFFINSSNEYLPVVVPALLAIACSKTAAITKDAIAALNVGDTPLAAQARDAALSEDHHTEQALGACDDRYFANDEPIADQLFAWI